MTYAVPSRCGLNVVACRMSIVWACVCKAPLPFIFAVAVAVAVAVCHLVYY